MGSEDEFASVQQLIDLAVGPPELNLKLLNTILHTIAEHVDLGAVRIPMPETAKLRNVEIGVEAGVLRPDIVRGSLPTADDLARENATPGSKCVVQMVNLLNITKRIEATELAIEKLMSLICSLASELRSKTPISESTSPQEAVVSLNVPSAVPHVLPKELVALIAQVSEMAELLKEIPAMGRLENIEKNKFDSNAIILERLNGVEEKIKSFQNNLHLRQMDNLPSKQMADLPSRQMANLNANKEFPEEFQVVKDRIYVVENVCQELVKSFDRQESLMQDIFSRTEISGSSTNNNPTASFYVDSSDQIKEIENKILKITKLENDLCEMKRDLSRVISTIEDLLSFSERTKQTLLDVYEKQEDIAVDVYNVNEDVNLLVQERKDRYHQVQALIEQVEQIKGIKADREEVEVMVNAKADKTELWKKVPYDEFHDAKQNLSIAIIEALERIVETDTAWNRAVDDINIVLKDKVEHSHADTMSKEFSLKLEALKDRIRGFAMFRLSCESAATSQKYLKEVKCIMCNAQSYMNPEVTLPPVPRLGNFGATISKEIKEFSRITVPCSRSVQIKGVKMVKRNCGGKHTQISAAEWNSRIGDFIDQTGAVPLSSNVCANYEQGSDGVLYRVDMETCGCTEPSTCIPHN